MSVNWDEREWFFNLKMASESEEYTQRLIFMVSKAKNWKTNFTNSTSRFVKQSRLLRIFCHMSYIAWNWHHSWKISIGLNYFDTVLLIVRRKNVRGRCVLVSFRWKKYINEESSFFKKESSLIILRWDMDCCEKRASAAIEMFPLRDEDLLMKVQAVITTQPLGSFAFKCFDSRTSKCAFKICAKMASFEQLSSLLTFSKSIRIKSSYCCRIKLFLLYILNGLNDW